MVRDGVALFSGGLRNVFSLADLKLERLLDSFDDWARGHDPGADLDPPERLAPTRVPASARWQLDLAGGEISTIVWATGFRPDYGWLDVPVVDEKGGLRHDGGVVDSPGLYALGLPVLRRRRSTFIHGIDDDAYAVVEHLTGHLAGRGPRLAEWGSVAACPSTQLGSRGVAVFTSGTEGYHTFRIPALLPLGEGRLLAFAEGRREGAADTGEIDLVQRHSDDGGRTWGSLEVVRHWPGYTCGNPAPVRTMTGDLVLLSMTNGATAPEDDILAGRVAPEQGRRVWVQRSRDLGSSWTEPVEITAAVSRPDWRWYATGPTAGSGPGRRTDRGAGQPLRAVRHRPAGARRPRDPQ